MVDVELDKLIKVKVALLVSQQHVLDKMKNGAKLFPANDVLELLQMISEQLDD